mgnify:CR=1 FL=1
MSHSHINKVTGAGLLITLGIIFGDIGTSPLYVMSAIMGGNIITRDLVFGGLSLVFWTLTIQTTVKYIILVLRADNKGEGGILALTALAASANKVNPRIRQTLLLFGVLGATLFYGDSVITPAISVLGALEGLEIATPNFKS